MTEHDLGQRFGRWAWRWTLAAPRRLLLAGIAAAFAHALVPTLSLGTYLCGLLAVDMLARRGRAVSRMRGDFRQPLP